MHSRTAREISTSPRLQQLRLTRTDPLAVSLVRLVSALHVGKLSAELSVEIVDGDLSAFEPLERALVPIGLLQTYSVSTSTGRDTQGRRD